MINKIEKILLYSQALHKGELAKKIEYKLKDITGYFYIRNKVQNKSKKCALKFPNITFRGDFSSEQEKIIRIFDKKYEYKDILKELSCEKQFWRKCNISQYEEIKKVWEINRLQFLLALAVQYNSKKDLPCKEEIINILSCWEKNNEFEKSINWSNNLEVAVRGINIALVLYLLNDTDANSKFSKLLYLHGVYLYNEINYSKKCIPNNHLLGEAIALLMLANIVKTAETKKWEKRATKVLMKYNSIIQEDGMSKENSFSYHFFVIKMFILALCFVKEEKLFKILNSKIIKSLEILKLTIIDDGSIINYGDNDDGFLYTIDQNYSISKDINRYYNYFFENKNDIETNIINELNKFYNPSNKIIFSDNKDKNIFYNKNIFINKWNNNILFFNAKEIEGHAHNDSLSVFLAINGKKIFLDSGTYSYNIDKEKRKYYRGREAHSTIQLKDEKTAIPVGSFRWKNINQSKIVKIDESENFIILLGTIENICSRKITINKKNNKIIIEDKVNDKNVFCNWFTEISNLQNECLIDENIKITFYNAESVSKNKVYISEKYLEEKEVILFKVKGKTNELKTIIEW